MNRIGVTIVTFCTLCCCALNPSIAVAQGCESGLSIRSVSSDGKIVILDDGSVWEVDDGDATDSALWLATDDIVACDDKLVNTRESETVSASLIK